MHLGKSRVLANQVLGTVFSLMVTASGCEVPPEFQENADFRGSQVCTLDFIHGIQLTVKSVSGVPIDDAIVTISDGSYVEQLISSGNGVFVGAGEREGTYSLSVSRAAYYPVTLDGILVSKDTCHVIPSSYEVTLNPIAYN
jgi:hypothetical protein